MDPLESWHRERTRTSFQLLKKKSKQRDQFIIKNDFNFLYEMNLVKKKECDAAFK